MLKRDDWQRILRALKNLEQDHRAARDEAEARAADQSNEFRREALVTASWHAEEINKLSILEARVWRLAQESASEAA